MADAPSWQPLPPRRRKRQKSDTTTESVSAFEQKAKLLKLRRLAPPDAVLPAAVVRRRERRGEATGKGGAAWGPLAREPAKQAAISLAGIIRDARRAANARRAAAGRGEALAPVAKVEVVYDALRLRWDMGIAFTLEQVAAMLDGAWLDEDVFAAAVRMRKSARGRAAHDAAADAVARRMGDGATRADGVRRLGELGHAVEDRHEARVRERLVAAVLASCCHSAARAGRRSSSRLSRCQTRH